jgi:hypothetical protein
MGAVWHGYLTMKSGLETWVCDENIRPLSASGISGIARDLGVSNPVEVGDTIDTWLGLVFSLGSGQVASGGRMFVGAARSAPARGVSVADAVDQGLVRPGGRLHGVLQAIEEEVAANPPTNQMGAMRAVGNATDRLGLEAGRSIGALPGQGDVVLQNVGGIITTLKASGEIIITNARNQVIYRYIPR